MKRVTDGNFIVQKDGVLMLIAFNVTAMVQNTHLPFFLSYGPKTAQSLSPMPHRSNSMSCNKT